MVKINPVRQGRIMNEPSVICSKNGGNLPGKTQCRRVGGDERVGRFPKAMLGWQGFLLEHIQHSACDTSIFQCTNQRRFMDDVSPANVHDKGCVRQGLKQGLIN